MQNFPSADVASQKTQVLGVPQNIAAVACYFPCTALVASILFLVTEPKSSRFVRFHALQSLFFGAAIAVVFIGLGIAAAVISIVLGMINGSLAALVGILVYLLIAVLALGVFGLQILAMVKAYGGQEYQLPVAGGIAQKYL